jgi:ankyrin repeat protein
VDAIELLLAQGADPNATNAAGATALMRAAGSYEKVRLLLAHGANPNAKSALGNTALILAANTIDSAPTVRALLEKGADVRATNRFGVTAIHTAAAAGEVQTLRLLLDRGADPDPKILPGPDAFVWGGGRTPLMWAALLGHEDCLKLLLEKGADVNATDFLGTALIQASWRDNIEIAKLLLEHGAKVDQRAGAGNFTPLLWAASTEFGRPDLVKLLLAKGADANAECGQDVDAFMGVPQTALILAEKRGHTPVVDALLQAGAKRAPSGPIKNKTVRAPDRGAEKIDSALIRTATEKSLPPLQQTAAISLGVFQEKQNCASCHQQYLPMMAAALARDKGIQRDETIARQQLETVLKNDKQAEELLLQATFHPAPAQTFGYSLLGLAAEKQPRNASLDAIVHHLSVIQSKDGHWYNLLPRPPIQSSDVAATALSMRALQLYPLEGRKAEFTERIARARQWLRRVEPVVTDERVFQLLGLAWAGEPAEQIAKLTAALLAEQRADGGWAQLSTLESDGYATGLVLYALNQASHLSRSDPGYERGIKFLLGTQLEDGTWFVQRRAFPFQPTMPSGFPHGRDAWISTAATSWAAMALMLSEPPQKSVASVEANINPSTTEAQNR